jgi:serine acetyltransferase
MTQPPHLDDEIYINWWHANHAWHHGDISAAHHLYKNLRANHSIELFYEVQLKNPTRFVHPIGTVLGRAEYARHLVVYQGVSVGSTVDNERPKFTGPCVLFPHSGVIGPVTVGSNVWITAGCIVEARCGDGFTIPDNSVVTRSATSVIGVEYHETTRSVIDTFFTPRRRTTDSGTP